MVRAVMEGFFCAVWKLVRLILCLVLYLFRFGLEILKLLLLFTGSVVKIFLLVFSGGQCRR